MSYYQKSGVTINDVYGAIAEAMLKELKSNIFAIDGFPEIRLLDKDGKFYISLHRHGRSSTQLILSKNYALFYASKFKRCDPVSDVLIRKVKDMCSDLETEPWYIKYSKSI